VKRSPSALRAVRSGLTNYFELFLTTIGVLVAIALTYSGLTGGEQGLALTFLVWLQGFILWAVHRHNWFRRRALVKQLRLMLQDRVNTQLTVLLGAAEASQRASSPVESEPLQMAIEAARTVSLELERLSVESLRTWERGHGRFLPSVLG
jgi:hypothetical protein